MKLLKIILLLFSTGMVVNGYSQVIYNGSFEELCYDSYNSFKSNCSAGITCPVFPSPTLSCVAGWQRSHGTPQIQGTAKDGTRCALMWSKFVTADNRTKGEGIFTNVCFNHNETYIISFWAKLSGSSAALDNLVVGATSSLVLSTSLDDGEPIPSVPGELLYNSSFNSFTWTKISIIYTPASTAPIRTQLWFFPSQSNTTEAFLLIDKVEVLKTTCCTPYRLIQNTSTISPPTKVDNYIRVGNNVDPDASNGDVDLLSGNSAVFTAGKYITFETGFIAEYGSGLSASISACTNSASCNYNDACGDNLSRISQVALDVSDNTSGTNEKDFMDTKGYPSLISQVALNGRDSIVATNEKYSTDIKIYPSPTNGKLYIDLIPAKGISITITNIMGIPVICSEYHNILYETKEIELSKLPDGIYIISINRDGIVKTETVTVMK